MRKFINREQLYIEVWKTPMTKVAPKYNLTAYELKKLCNSLWIPLPKAGHWSKIKHGKNISTPILPSLFNPLCPYECCSIENMIKKQDSHLPKKIKIKKTLQNPHPLITKTKITLKSMPIDDYGMKRIIRNGINLRTSKVNETRALRIMDSIFKCFEKNGAKILYPYENNMHTYIEIENEKIEIFIEEKSKYIGMIKKKYGSYSREVRGYKPTGILTIGVGPYCCYGSGLPKTFSDGKTKKLEDQINDFIKSVYDHAEYKKQQTIKRKIEEELQEIARKEKIYRQQCEELEKQMSDQLIKDVTNFHKCQQLQVYIEEVYSRAKIKYPDGKFPQELFDWIKWANNHIIALDPLSQGLPKYISATELIKVNEIEQNINL